MSPSVTDLIILSQRCRSPSTRKIRLPGHNELPLAHSVFASDCLAKIRDTPASRPSRIRQLLCERQRLSILPKEFADCGHRRLRDQGLREFRLQLGGIVDRRQCWIPAGSSRIPRLDDSNRQKKRISLLRIQSLRAQGRRGTESRKVLEKRHLLTHRSMWEWTMKVF